MRKDPFLCFVRINSFLSIFVQQSAHKCDQILTICQNYKSCFQFWKGLFSIWKKFERTLANLKWFWANFHRSKWPNIEEINRPSGHTTTHTPSPIRLNAIVCVGGWGWGKALYPISSSPLQSQTSLGSFGYY